MMKMMTISWREKKTNEEAPTLADEHLYIIPTIKKRKITYFGHMIRRNNIHMLISEGPLEGGISRGRPTTEWMTNITVWTGMRCEDLVRLAQDREPWSIMTTNLLKCTQYPAIHTNYSLSNCTISNKNILIDVVISW